MDNAEDKTERRLALKENIEDMLLEGFHTMVSKLTKDIEEDRYETKDLELLRKLLDDNKISIHITQRDLDQDGGEDDELDAEDLESLDFGIAAK